MSRTLFSITALMVAILVGVPIGSSLYLYVPDVLVVSDEDEADEVLAGLEASFGVQAAYDPVWAARPDLARLDRTAKVMERHWQRLDATCDNNGVFALMYLYTTYGVRRHVEAGYFADNDYLSVITVSFAELYLGAWEKYQRGDLANVPTPWLYAFQYADSGQGTITEDEFLGMNAHINYDLAIAEASLGTDGRKPDMDRINHVLNAVSDEVQYVMALYYGPAPPTAQPDWSNNESSDPATVALIEGIAAWREHAWQNAVLIESTPSPSVREAHDSEMQTYAGTIAQGFMTPKLSSPQPERLAYCQANP